MEFADGTLTAEAEGPVGLIAFNNRQKRNAISMRMWEGLLGALTGFEHDAAIRAVILTGADDLNFASGADITEFGKRRTRAEVDKGYETIVARARQRIASFPKPVIASIRGFCLGGGLAVALEADIRLASDDAQFSIPAARIGLSLSLDGMRRLVTVVGSANARMILYTGRRISAADARAMGLVNEVVPNDRLALTAKELAQSIAHNAPLSLHAIKLAMRNIVDGSVEAASVDSAIETCFESADFREGSTAFLEKRSPKFLGR